MKHPLNLPAGSVRSILTLAVMATICTCVITSLPVSEGFYGMAGMVLAYYFKTREKEA